MICDYHPIVPFFCDGELGGRGMKFSGRRVGAFVGCTALTLFSVGMVGVGAASAASRAKPAVLSPVGLYNYTDGGIITEGGAAATMTINANGTFNLLYASITDTGVWLTQGKTIALTITSGEDGSAGCLLLGTIERKGINSSAKQGPINCEAEFAKTGSWYDAVPHHVR